MDRAIFVPSAALALALIGLYVAKCWRGRSVMEVGVLVSVAMHCTGIVAGVTLVASAFLPELRTRLSGMDLYFFISGIAVLAVSIQGVNRDVGLRARRDPTPAAASPALARTADPLAPRDLAVAADAVASR